MRGVLPNRIAMEMKHNVTNQHAGSLLKIHFQCHDNVT